jgi:hypothetical protein
LAGVTGVSAGLGRVQPRRLHCATAEEHLR